MANHKVILDQNRLCTMYVDKYSRLPLGTEPKQLDEEFAYYLFMDAALRHLDKLKTIRYMKRNYQLPLADAVNVAEIIFHGSDDSLRCIIKKHSLI